MADNRQEGKEQELRTWLKSLDPLLDIVYLPWAERYSIICSWPQSDPRWPLYQKGDIGDHYDSLGWLCTDPGDASSIPVNLDDCEAIVVKRLAACDNTHQPWAERMKETIVKNQKMKKSRKDIALEQAADIAGSLRGMIGRVEEVKMERIFKEISEGQV